MSIGFFFAAIKLSSMTLLRRRKTHESIQQTSFGITPIVISRPCNWWCLGDIFKDMIPIIGYGKTIGFPPVTIDLSVMKITLGFLMQINLASIIGLMIAVFIFSRI